MDSIKKNHCYEVQLILTITEIASSLNQGIQTGVLLLDSQKPLIRCHMLEFSIN